MMRTVSVLLAIAVLAACKGPPRPGQVPLQEFPEKFPIAPAPSVPPKMIPFQGLDIDNEGMAGWNAGLTAPEEAKIGHPAPWASSCAGATPVATYYFASRDYVGIDLFSSGGLHFLPPVSGFDEFTEALANNGFTIDQLTMKWGVQDLGDDEEDSDWSYSEPVETRRYTGGDFTIKLNGEPMVGGPMPRTIVTINYNSLTDCYDDQISAVTATVVPQNLSGGSSVAVQAVAAAFLRDLGTHGVNFRFDSFQPAASHSEFVANGRSGAFYDLPSGRIQTQATTMLPSAPTTKFPR